MFSFLTSFAITLPETAIQDILANASGIFGDLKELFLFIFGVFLAVRILFFVVNMMRPAQTTEYYDKVKEFYGDQDNEYDEPDEF